VKPEPEPTPVPEERLRSRPSSFAQHPAKVVRSKPPISVPAAEYVIEVPAEDMDLTQLAELAKNALERNPK
jgi:hypothetical protein